MEVLRDKVFLICSLGVTLLFVLLCRNTTEVLVVLGIYGVTLANLLGLAFVVRRLIYGAGGESKGKLVAIFLGKTLLFFASLSLGVHFIGARVLMPVLNYVIQIFVLCICMWRCKKGTSK